MKVVILTAGIGEKKLSIPKCFTITVGSVPLIEYLVRTLRLLNVLPKNIYLATSANVKWGGKKYHKVIESLGVNEIVVKKNSRFSFPTLLKTLEEFDSEDTLVINGDYYFKLSELEYLLDKKVKNSIALSQSRNAASVKEPLLEIYRGKIVKVNQIKTSKEIPWFMYFGAMFIKKLDIKKVKNCKVVDIPYLNYLVNNLKIKIDARDVHSFSEKRRDDKLKELSGGSFAMLKKEILVVKKADKIGRDKLIQEIKWLNNLDDDTSDKFPKVLDFNISSNRAWYSMPWYPRPSLRKNIISGFYQVDDVEKCMHPILNFLWNDLYRVSEKNINIGWVNKRHFDRFYKRFAIISKIKPFQNMIKSNEIIINKICYKNLHVLVDWLKNFNDRYKFFVPKSLNQIHGDLHFQNILVGESPKDFILADPRGDKEGSDVFYDMGKLWHSFNGKYDLIHTDISVSKILGNKYTEYELVFGPNYLVDTYNSIEKSFMKLMKKYPISNDKNWLLKTNFAEFMHFSSLTIFHLKNDKIENRAVSLYLSAVILGTKLIDQLKNNKVY
jgi:hypothetical protein